MIKSNVQNDRKFSCRLNVSMQQTPVVCSIEAIFLKPGNINDEVTKRHWANECENLVHFGSLVSDWIVTVSVTI